MNHPNRSKVRHEIEIIIDLLKAFDLLNPRGATWKTPTDSEELQILRAIAEAERYARPYLEGRQDFTAGEHLRGGV